MLASKADLLVEPLSQETINEYNKFCREKNIIGWYPVSAKSNTGLGL